MRKLIASLALGLCALGFSAASYSQDAASAPAVTASAAAPAAASDAAAASAPVETVNKGDTAWMLVSTILVIMMSIPGLALFYGGLDLHLGQEVDDVLRTAIQLGVALLAAEALHFGHRDALHADGAEGFADFVKLERLDDGGHHLHGRFSNVRG